jgi:hypothetical protein
MKKLVLTLAASVVALGAFAQGKIFFTQDSLHLAFYDPSSGSLGGQGLSSSLYPTNSSTGLPISLMADLYMGTSSSALYLYSSTTMGVAPGHWANMNVQAQQNATTGAPLILGGTTVFVVAQIRDAASTPENIFSPTPFGTWWGASQAFTFLLGSAPTYPAMYGANGTWGAGGFNMDQYGTGSRGAVMVSPVPEPTSFALAGLGAAAMLIFRRRK